MNEAEIRELVSSVLQNYATGKIKETDIPLEVSARHVHLTQEALEVLFGPGASLTFKRELSQPGQFLSEEKVKLVTVKGTLEKVSVLGPLRDAVQAELSLTDCRALGIHAPVNLSGNLRGAGDVILIGPCGVLEAKSCVIAAKAHIHLDPGTASEKGLVNGQSVRVRIHSGRPVCLEDVSIRVSEKFRPAMHIDFDEANACDCDSDSTVEIIP